MMPSRGYLICCIERTGSNVLTHALSDMQQAGRPIEFFNPVMQDKPPVQDILGGSALRDGLPKILSAGATANGMFGAKVHWSHLRFLGMSLAGEWSDAERFALSEVLVSKLPTLFPRAAACALLRSQFSDLSTHNAGLEFLRSRLPKLQVIWLRRDNMVARAISHLRAFRTGVWYQARTDNERTQPAPWPKFNFAEIHLMYCLAAFQEEMWQKFFKENGICPHSVVYEELMADYEGTIRRVLNFLGITTHGASIPPPRSIKQSDATSRQWEERYRILSAESGLTDVD